MHSSPMMRRISNVRSAIFVLKQLARLMRYSCFGRDDRSYSSSIARSLSGTIFHALIGATHPSRRSLKSDNRRANARMRDELSTRARRTPLAELRRCESIARGLRLEAVEEGNDGVEEKRRILPAPLVSFHHLLVYQWRI